MLRINANGQLEDAVQDLFSDIQGVHYWCNKALKKWFADLAKVKSSTSIKKNIVFMGDSMLSEVGASVASQTGIPSLIRKHLATKYGDCGRGFIHALFPRADAPLISYTNLGTAWVPSPYTYGAGSWIMTTTTVNATLEHEFDSPTIKILFPTGSGLSAFQIYIDNVLHSTVDPKAITASNVYEHTLSGYTGTHTIKLVFTVGQNETGKFIGFREIKGTSGIEVNNCAVAGNTTEGTASTGSLYLAFDHFEPSLVIVDGTGNDWNMGVSSYYTNLVNIADYAIAKGVPIIFLSCGRFMSTHTPTNAIANWDDYRDIMFNVAQAKGIAFIDLINTWDKVNDNQADWADDNDLLDDNVHTNDAGNRMYADTLLKVIDPI